MTTAMTRQFGVLAFIVLAAAGCGGGGGGGGGGGDKAPPPLPAGSVSLGATTYTIASDVPVLTVAVARTDGGSRATNVSYATTDGSALAGTDYVTRTGTLTWARGDTSEKTFSIPIKNLTRTNARTFDVTLSNPTDGVALGLQTRATVSITANSQAKLAVSVRGNRLVDAAGNILQLRGVNFSGFEFVAINGFNPGDPSGGQAGQPNGPKWSAVTAWRANAVSFALNEASWLGATCVDTDGVSRNADPGANYRAAVQTQVEQATGAGLYVIIELHWAAPGNTCPLVQTQMANADHSVDFWTSIATAFKGNPAVLFSLYNEPYMYGLTATDDPWAVMMKTGGSLSYYPATSGTHNYQNINTSWRVVSMQALLDAVRATGSSNVVLVGGVDYGNNLEKWLATAPTDSLNQLAAAWHPYPPTQSASSATISGGGTGYAVGDTITLAKPNTVYAPVVLDVTAVGTGGAVSAATVRDKGVYLQTGLPSGAVAQSATSGAGTGAAFTLGGWNNISSTWSMPSNWPTVTTISAKVPVVISETGEHNAPGTSGSPFLQQLLPAAGANNWSVFGCCWDVFTNPDNVLIKDVDGTPTDGYGQVMKDWMTGVAWQ
jgi:hypothetical protein